VVKWRKNKIGEEEMKVLKEVYGIWEEEEGAENGGYWLYYDSPEDCLTSTGNYTLEAEVFLHKGSVVITKKTTLRVKEKKRG
jgi:ribonucleotide reductase alpha subunit